jgi:hypothetical protein
MAKTLFDFSEMVVECIHTEDFTNALKVEEIKTTLANFFITIKGFSQYNLTEMSEIDKHCHEVKSEYLK